MYSLNTAYDFCNEQLCARTASQGNNLSYEHIDIANS